ncbi:MAG: T9SS type A sorting domain-containing protein, partial [Cytophagales bacterium]|nr:T9SS type A sorting domain-containing protein [Cytophagales bacterium]
ANYGAARRYQDVSIFENSSWSHINLGVGDIISTTYNPFNGNQYFMTLASRGIAVLKPDNSVSYLNDLTPGSTLIDPVRPGAGYLRMTDAVVDSKGVLWMLQASESALRPIIHSLDLSGNWKSYSIITNDNDSYAGNIILDDYNNKWIKIGARDFNGLLVFNEKTSTGQKVRKLGVEKGNGNLPDINVRCVEKDTNGEIWVGTAKGVAVFYNPSTIFANQGFDAGRPIYNSRPLLDGQDVLDIKVDGGNRKWMATNQGVWLFSADGSQVIYNFTSENSPLPSNQVIDIDIDGKTGEVFFVTNGGVASFRDGASIPETSASNFQVFPNPVTPTFSGEVGISGLTFQSFVKITDISGRLVYQTSSQGGTATWNLITTSGEKAKAGIYLIFAVNQDGTEQLVSKLAVVD